MQSTSWNLEVESKAKLEAFNVKQKLEADVDDLEQYGRRYCVRIYNLPVKEHETEEQLFTSLKTELKKVRLRKQFEEMYWVLKPLMVVVYLSNIT